jgi:gliding motility-associated-like protein
VRTLSIIAALALWLTNFQGSEAQCPSLTALNINGSPSTNICAPDGIELAVTGIQLPSGGQVQWFYSSSPAFNPRNGEGTLFETTPLPILPPPGSGSCATKCPDLLMLFVNSCNGTGAEPDNEFFVLNSGGGFLADDLQFELDPANSFPGGQDNSINIGTNPCRIRQPSATLISQLRTGACNAGNLIPAGPGTAIPPDALVVFFTSSSVTIDYDFGSFCASGRDVYVMQSNCNRTVGAFTNAASCASNNRIRTQALSIAGCPCRDVLSYDRCGMLNLDGEYVVDTGEPIASISNTGIRFNAGNPCASPDYEQFAKADTILYATLDIDSTNSPLCGGTIYIKTLVSPSDASCPQSVSNSVSLELNCPDFSIVDFPANVCSGDPVNIRLSGGSNAVYTWTVNQGTNVTGLSNGNSVFNSITQTPILTGTQPQTVTYTIRSGQGSCQSPPQQVLINVLPKPSASISGAPQFCTGSSTTLSVNAGNSNILWSTGAGTTSISVSSPGVYYVVVDNGTCRDSSGIVVTEVPQITPIITGDTLLCPGGTGSLQATLGFSSYLWNTGENGPQINVSVGGIYTVTVTQGACSGTGQIEVEVLPPLTGIEEIVSPPTCLGASDGQIEIKVNYPLPVTITWATGWDQFIYPNIQAGEYPYVLFYGNCGTGPSILMGDGPPLVLNLDVDNLGCDGAEGGVTVVNVFNNTGALTYALNGGNFQASSTFSPLPVGDYTIAVRNDLGCEASSNFSISGPLPLRANIATVPSGCEFDTEGSIQVISVDNAFGTVSYALNAGAFQTSPIFQGLSAGTYTLRLLDQSGCSADTVIDVRRSNLVSIILPDTIFVKQGTTITLRPQISGSDPQTSYFWSPSEGLTCDDCDKPSLTAFQNALYTLSIINGDGCSTSESVFISILPILRAYLPDAFSPNGDGINDRFYLLSDNEGLLVTSLEVFDRWGRKVFSVTNVPGTDPAFGWDGQVDGQDGPMDAYIYRATWLWPDGTSGEKVGSVLLVR